MTSGAKIFQGQGVYNVAFVLRTNNYIQRINGFVYVLGNIDSIDSIHEIPIISLRYNFLLCCWWDTQKKCHEEECRCFVCHCHNKPWLHCFFSITNLIPISHKSIFDTAKIYKVSINSKLLSTNLLLISFLTSISSHLYL